MCGIYGSPNLSEASHLLLPFLGNSMMSRGRDGWGASDGSSIVKKKGPLFASWAEEMEAINSWPRGIFHTRGASLNTPKEEENAHPFVGLRDDGSSIIGIHNGLISNSKSLNEKYGRTCEVDSEHLWLHRAAGLPWSELQGWGNLAWWETVEGERRLHLLRFNADSLKVARLKDGTYFFCSESAPLIHAGTFFGNPPEAWFNIDAETHYFFTESSSAPGGVTLLKGEKIEFGRAPVVAITPSIPWDGSATYSPSTVGAVSADNYCALCNSVRIRRDDELLCTVCFRHLLDEWEASARDGKAQVVGTVDPPHGDAVRQCFFTPGSSVAHLRLKIHGGRDAESAFHYLLGRLDCHYPAAPPHLRPWGGGPQVCGACTGWIWAWPRFAPWQLRSLGRQVNASPRVKTHLRVRVMMFNPRCPGKPSTSEESSKSVREFLTSDDLAKELLLGMSCD